MTFNILVSCEHRLLPFSLFTKYLVHFLCLRYGPKQNYAFIGSLFDKINLLIKQDEGTRGLFIARIVHRVNYLFLFSQSMWSGLKFTIFSLLKKFL